MSALKPSDDRHVRGVASVRYPLNQICAHPECSKPTESAHHAFPRSQIGNGSWFVAFTADTTSGTLITKDAIPHVIGLCGSGTTGHHGDLEAHRAWIKLEDGIFVWYERIEEYRPGVVSFYDDGVEGEWLRVGPLNPQPGSREGKPKRRKKSSSSEERKDRKVLQIRTPAGEEQIIPELVDAVRELRREQMGWSETAPPHYVIVYALAKDLQ